jgi:hypothetical protein
VEIDFDPQQISYGRLLDEFYRQHLPVRPAYSRQYRSAVFYHSEEQRVAAEAALVKASRRAGVSRITTDIEPAGVFYRAEGYHQKYYLTFDTTLMRELERLYPRQRDFEDSTLVMRLNALCGHYQLAVDTALPLDILSPAARLRVQELQAYTGGPALRCAN